MFGEFHEAAENMAASWNMQLGATPSRYSS